MKQMEAVPKIKRRTKQKTEGNARRFLAKNNYFIKILPFSLKVSEIIEKKMFLCYNKKLSSVNFYKRKDGRRMQNYDEKYFREKSNIRAGTTWVVLMFLVTAFYYE